MRGFRPAYILRKKFFRRNEVIEKSVFFHRRVQFAIINRHRLFSRPFFSDTQPSPMLISLGQPFAEQTVVDDITTLAPVNDIASDEIGEC